MPERIEIRPEDAAAPPGSDLLDGFVAELIERYGEFDPSSSPSATPADFGPPGGSFLVAYLDGEPAGCGGVKRLRPDCGEIKRMFVAESARGHGVGRRLLGALEDEGRRLGYSRIRLDTGTLQHEARKLYSTAGYRPIPDYNGNPYASFWFEKWLGRRYRSTRLG